MTAPDPPRPRSRQQRWLLRIAVVIIVAAVSTACFRKAGVWLIVQDPLEHAQAMAVFGGGIPFRAMGGAELYKEGWAPEVWLTRTAPREDEEAMSRIGVDATREDALSRQVLEKLGVPAGAIRVVPGTVVNTAGEVRAIAKEVRARNGGTVIIVTSKYHTRRVRTLWRILVGRRPQAVVRYSPDDPSQPERWWTNTGDATAVTHEWFGLVNAWTGFPVRSDPR